MPTVIRFPNFILIIKFFFSPKDEQEDTEEDEEEQDEEEMMEEDDEEWTGPDVRNHLIQIGKCNSSTVKISIQ